MRVDDGGGGAFGAAVEGDSSGREDGVELGGGGIDGKRGENIVEVGKAGGSRDRGSVSKDGVQLGGGGVGGKGGEDVVEVGKAGGSRDRGSVGGEAGAEEEGGEEGVDETHRDSL